MSLLDPKLQAFISVVRHQTVHGAAKDLKLTQTGITQRIRTLETQLGVTLFTRSRKGMLLTQEGEALNRYCLGTSDLEGLALSQMVGAGRTASIRVTVTGPTSILTSRIVPACSGLYKKYPELYLNFEIDDSENRLAQVKRGAVQFAIVPPEQVANEMDSKVLKPDKYILVGSAKWRNRKVSEIIQTERIIDFYSSDETTFKYLRKYDLFEKSRRERIYANNNDSLIKLLSEGIGYGTLTQEVAAPHIERGALTIFNGKNSLEDPQALVWYPRPQVPDYFKSIIQAIG